MKNYLIKRGQSSIEFSIALVLAILFMYLSCNLFVWLNHNIVERQREYENSRNESATSPEANNPYVNRRDADPGKLDFYTPKKMDLFVPGGYN